MVSKMNDLFDSLNKSYISLGYKTQFFESQKREIFVARKEDIEIKITRLKAPVLPVELI